MKTGNKKVLLIHSPQFYHMINLRLIGLSLTSLGAMFGVHWTSVRHHTRFFQIPRPEEVYNLESIIAQVIPSVPKITYKLVNGERINLGKSYKEYLAENRYPHS